MRNTAESPFYAWLAQLPPGAYNTGWHRGDWYLWISPSDIDNYVYVVNEDRAERWDRTPRPIYCA